MGGGKRTGDTFAGRDVLHHPTALVRAQPSLSLAWGQDTSLCLPHPLMFILSQWEAKKYLEIETAGAWGKQSN